MIHYRMQGYKQLLAKNTGRMKVSDRLRVAPGVPKMQQLCGSMGEIQMSSTACCPEGIQITGSVLVRAFYATADAEMPFGCLKGQIPFSYVLEVLEADADCDYEIVPALSELNVVMQDGSEAEVRAELCFQGLVCRVREEPMISEVKASAPDAEKLAALPGIVAYIVRDGDSLWNIGKRYYVPVARLREMNGLAGDEVKPGDKILVVKGA